MSGAERTYLRLPVRRGRHVYERLWREWCFARVAARHFRVHFLLLLALLVGGGILFRALEPEKQHSLPRAVYYTWSLIFGQPPEEFPRAIVLQLMFFVVPLVGMLVIIEGLVDFALMLRDRRRSERNWCHAMAAALTNHVILVGVGKLGIRAYRLLRQLGESVVVIESEANNQFLDEIRRDGCPLFIGDARREAFLVDAHIAAAKSIILATNRDLTNLEIALDARRLNPNIRVVLRMFDQNMADKICEGFHIQTAMSQSAISAPAFVMAALEHSIVGTVVVGDELLLVQRRTLQRDGPLCGRSVGAALSDCGVAVVQLRRNGAAPQLLPSVDTCLKEGDEVHVQGPLEALRKLGA